MSQASRGVIVAVMVSIVVLPWLGRLGPVTAASFVSAQASAASLQDDTRKVPKTKPETKPDPKPAKPDPKPRPKPAPKPDPKPEAKPKDCHAERYICGSHLECPDGNKAPCWPMPNWCTRTVCK